MATATATWAIPYPQGSDRLCDGYLFMQQMAERIDEILDEFDVDLDRVTVVPLVRVSVLTPTFMGGGDFSTNIEFQNVDFDTRGDLADLSQDDEFIKTLEGYFVSGGNADFKYGVGSAGAVYDLEQIPVSGNSSHATEQRDNAAYARLVNMAMERSAQEDHRSLFMVHGGATPAGTPVLHVLVSYFWYQWVGDL